MRKLWILLAGCIWLLTGQVSAQTIYVSNRPGGQVLAYSATGGTPVVYTISGVVRGVKNYFPEDLTVGPNGKVYVCAPANNLLISFTPGGNPKSTVFNAVASIQCQSPRFNAFGDLLVNTNSGIRIFSNLSNPQSLVSQSLTSAEGVAFDNNGSLYFVDQGAGVVYRSALTGCSVFPTRSCSYASATSFLTGLTNPVGVARDSHNNIFVADQTGVKTSGGQTVASVSDLGGRTPYFMRFTADDSLYIAAAFSPSVSTNPNGAIYRASGGNVTQIAVLPTVNGKFPPAWGIALTPSSVSFPTKLIPFANSQTTFNTGHDAFQIGVPSSGFTGCTATATVTQKYPSQVNPLLGSGYSAISELGQEGLINVFTLNAPTCDGLTFYALTMAGLYPAEAQLNPVLFKCDNGNCTVPPRFGVSYFGLLPDDGSATTKSNSFSDWIVANQQLTTQGGQSDTFCGLLSPFSNDTSNPSVVNPGSALPLKFQLITGQNQSCSSTNLDTTGNMFVSAQLCTADGCAGQFSPQGATVSGNSNSPPQFRVDPTSGTYIYNLNTTNLDGTDWPSGTYVLTIFGDKVFPTTRCFCVGQCSASCPANIN